MTSIDVSSASTGQQSRLHFSPPPSFPLSLSPLPPPSPSCSLPSDLLSPLSPSSVQPSVSCITAIYHDNNNLQNKSLPSSDPPLPPPRRSESFVRVAENIRQLKLDRRLSSSLPTLIASSLGRSGLPYKCSLPHMSMSAESINNRGNSPPPPPPPPSYLFPQLSITSDLPLPPPPNVISSDTVNPLSSKKNPPTPPLKKKKQVFIYSYDPPSPEEKTTYDPPSLNEKLPENFAEVVCAELVKLEAPTRPDPPPPPTPPVRQSSKDAIIPPKYSSDVKTDTNNRQEDDKIAQDHPSTDLANTSISSITDSLQNEEIEGALKHDIETSNLESNRTDSMLSTSTLSASLLLTQDSNISPLPPHDMRVSPLLTDSTNDTPEPTPSTNTDNLTSSSNSLFPENYGDIVDAGTAESSGMTDTISDMAELQDAHNQMSPAPSESITSIPFSYNDAHSLLSPTLSDDFMSLQTERSCNSTDTSYLTSSSFYDLHKDSSTDVTISTPGLSDPLECLTPSTLRVSSESLFVLDSTSARASECLDDKFESLLLESDRENSKDITEVSADITSERARKSSPLSTETQSVSSLPTDTITINVGFDSASTDTEVQSILDDSNDVIPPVTNNDSLSVAAEGLESSPELSERAYTTADSAFESPSTSPIYTESSTYTPLPVEYVTPSSTNPKNTPLSSPLPCDATSTINTSVECTDSVKSVHLEKLDDTDDNSDPTYEDIEINVDTTKATTESVREKIVDIIKESSVEIEAISDCYEEICNSSDLIKSHCERDTEVEQSIKHTGDREEAIEINKKVETDQDQLHKDLHTIFETAMMTSELECNNNTKSSKTEHRLSKSLDSQNSSNLSLDLSCPASSAASSSNYGLSIDDTNSVKDTLADLTLIEKAEVARNSLTLTSPPRTPKEAIKILDNLTETLDSLSAELLTRYPKGHGSEYSDSDYSVSDSSVELSVKPVVLRSKLNHIQSDSKRNSLKSPTNEENINSGDNKNSNLSWENNNMYVDMSKSKRSSIVEQDKTEDSDNRISAELNKDSNGNLVSDTGSHHYENVQTNTTNTSDLGNDIAQLNKNNDNNRDSLNIPEENATNNEVNSIVLYNKIVPDGNQSSNAKGDIPAKLQINGNMYISNDVGSPQSNIAPQLNKRGCSLSDATDGEMSSNERSDTPSFLNSISHSPPSGFTRTFTGGVPPSPPPRMSRTSTPKMFIINDEAPPLPPHASHVSSPPLPPPRQYMLIPITPDRQTPLGISPPLAPPRSTSLRKSPTPTPRPSEPDLPEHLPPIPGCDSIEETAAVSVPSSSKLTPVPEETSSTHSVSPVPSLLRASPTPSKRLSPVPNRSKSPLDPSRLPKARPTSTSPGRSVIHSSSDKSNQATAPEVPPRPTISQELIDRLPPVPPPPPPISLRGLGGQCAFFPNHPHSPISKPVIPLPPPPPPVRIKPLTPPLPPPPKLVIPSSETDSCSSSPPPPPPPPSEGDNVSSHLPPLPPPPPTNICHTHSPKPSKSIAENRSSVVRELEEMIKASENKSMQSSKTEVSSVVTDSAMSSIVPDSSTCDTPPSPSSPQSSVVSSSPDHMLISVSPYGKLVVNRSDIPLPSPEDEVRKAHRNSKNWGWLHPDVDTLSVYTQLRPIIQQGPQCGLVALSMATQVCEKTCLVQDILHEARKKGYTKHGEMFSAEDMALLSASVTKVDVKVRKDVLCNPKVFLQILLQGDLILVPYDAEQNHLPGLKNGHKSHWGIISGCLAQSTNLKCQVSSTFHSDTVVDKLWHLRPMSRGHDALDNTKSQSDTTDLITATSKEPDLKVGEHAMQACKAEVEGRSASRASGGSRGSTPLVEDLLQDDLTIIALWRHGKSRNLMAAPLQELCESNDQLTSYDISSEAERDYVIKSVQEGLSGQVVVIHKTKSALSDLLGAIKL